MHSPPGCADMIRIPPYHEKYGIRKSGYRIFGGDGGIRTLDLTDANRTLSQLSYAPMRYSISSSKRYYITNFSFVKKKIDYFFHLYDPFMIMSQ